MLRLNLKKGILNYTNSFFKLDEEALSKRKRTGFIPKYSFWYVVYMVKAPQYILQ